LHVGFVGRHILIELDFGYDTLLNFDEPRHKTDG
jgi:hypothetical protein